MIKSPLSMFSNSYEETFHKLIAFEKRYNPFSWQIDNIPIWCFSRFNIMVEMLAKSGQFSKGDNSDLRRLDLKILYVF